MLCEAIYYKQQPLPCRRRLELLVLAKVKAQLHQIGERSDNYDGDGTRAVAHGDRRRRRSQANKRASKYATTYNQAIEGKLLLYHHTTAAALLASARY